MISDSAVGRLIALLALAVFSGTLVTRLTDPLVAVLAQDLGGTTARAALLASAFALPFALIQPILGPVGDALGKRRVMSIAVGLLTLLLIACAFAPDLDSLIVLRALSGLAAGGTAEAGLAIAAFGAGGLIYAAIAKRILGRMGQDRMVLLGGALCLVAYLGFAFAPAAWVFIGAGLVLGTGMYMIHNSIQTRVTEVAPKTRGAAVALHAFHFFLGQTAGPIVFGLILNHAGAQTAFMVGGISLLALAVLLGHRGVNRANAAT